MEDEKGKGKKEKGEPTFGGHPVQSRCVACRRFSPQLSLAYGQTAKCALSVVCWPSCPADCLPGWCSPKTGFGWRHQLTNGGSFALCALSWTFFLTLGLSLQRPSLLHLGRWSFHFSRLSASFLSASSPPVSLRAFSL